MRTYCAERKLCLVRLPTGWRSSWRQSKVLPEIRRLLIEGKNVEAEALVNANFTCKVPLRLVVQYGCTRPGNLQPDFQPRF